MLTKFINFLTLSSGFRSLWILSLLFACSEYPNEIKNPGFLLDGEAPTNWIFSGDSLAFDFQNRTKPSIIGSNHENRLSQKVQLDSGSYFIIGKFRADVDSGNMFISVTGNTINKERLFIGDEAACKRTLFSVHIDYEQVVELSIGLKENSSGSLNPDTLFIYKEKYFKNRIQNVNAIKKEIYDITGIEHFDGPAFDDQVEKIGSAINSSFLDKSDQQAIEIASIFSSEIFNKDQTSYLYTYVSDKNVRNAYCQKSSLSLDEILKLYNIPVRQIHWQENCSGFHQFTEYWNPFDEKWKLIDIYYGIRYINGSGDYLGFEEVEGLLRENEFGANNILQKNIGRLYFNEKEILEGWEKADLAIRIIQK